MGEFAINLLVRWPLLAVYYPLAAVLRWIEAREIATLRGVVRARDTEIEELKSRISILNKSEDLLLGIIKREQERVTCETREHATRVVLAEELIKRHPKGL